MANSNNPTTRRLRQENAERWIAQKKAGGAVKIAVLLPAESAAKLKKLAEIHGNKTAAIIAAIDRISED